MRRSLGFWIALVLVAVAVIAALAAKRWRPAPSPGESPSGEPITARPSAPATPPPPSSRLAVRPPPAADAAPRPVATTTPSPLDLSSAQATVRTQIGLLKSSDDRSFVETFLPSIQPQLTPAAIEACRRRVLHAAVEPDWEMAEQTTGPQGEPVLRVSMFGKSATGFHDLGGRWLADFVWCLPRVP